MKSPITAGETSSIQVKKSLENAKYPDRKRAKNSIKTRIFKYFCCDIFFVGGTEFESVTLSTSKTRSNQLS